MKIKLGLEQEYLDYKSNNSKDPYSMAVVIYSETWADLMEQKLASGEKLVDFAKKTSHDADTDGITGFMYGCSVQGLSYFWIHGEELRQWHNLATQIGDEGEKANKSGGVLNPAILNIKA
jgi:hypothetical protein